MVKTMMTSSENDRQRLHATLGNESLVWLLGRLRKQLERGLPLRGIIRLRHVTAAQRDAVDRLLGRRPSTGDSLAINLDQLEATLRRAELCNDLSEAVEALLGPIANRRALRADEEARWQHLFDSQRHEGRLDKRWYSWLAAIQLSGLLRRLSGNDAVAAGQLLGQAIAVLSKLPCHGIPLAELAATTLGDSHALDFSQPVGTLVLRAIAEPTTSDNLGDTRRARARARATIRRDAWASMGVMLDELSAPVLVLNLKGDEQSLTGRSLNLHAAAGEPCRLSVRQLLREPPRFESHQDVFVCENPTVVAAAANRFGTRCAPLICLDGQPKTAARLLLKLLVDAGAKLVYHGDFDWAGIQIANLVMRRHGALPWRFESTDYRDCSGGAQLTGLPVNALWDETLAPTMQSTGRAIHEEQVLDSLLTDLATQRP
jgi:uncharacterized protein (TIGR02679 family)